MLQRDFGNPSLRNQRNKNGTEQICRGAFPSFLGTELRSHSQAANRAANEIGGCVSGPHQDKSKQEKFAADCADAVQTDDGGKWEHEKDERGGTYRKPTKRFFNMLAAEQNYAGGTDHEDEKDQLDGRG